MNGAMLGWKRGEIVERPSKVVYTWKKTRSIAIDGRMGIKIFRRKIRSRKAGATI